MTIAPLPPVEKYCFVYCGERCDCLAGRKLDQGLADWIASGIPTEGGDNSLAPFMGSPPEGDAQSSPTRSTLLSQDKRP